MRRIRRLNRESYLKRVSLALLERKKKNEQLDRMFLPVAVVGKREVWRGSIFEMLHNRLSPNEKRLDEHRRFQRELIVEKKKCGDECGVIFFTDNPLPTPIEVEIFRWGRSVQL